jgi:uncharacterized membrane protein
MGDDSGPAAIVVAAFMLALFPALIARSKGRNFGLWYLYGLALFLIAMIHALVLKPIDEDLSRMNAMAAQADALTKFAQLKKDGLITEAEFEAKKRQLMGSDQTG